MPGRLEGLEPTMKQVALLRGINVGGKHRLAMSELVGLFEEAGCRGVTTYIQSGNVVFKASEALAGMVAKEVRSRILTRHGFDVPIVVRTARELARVMDGNPFLKERVPTAALHVMFLSESPPASRAAKLDYAKSPGDSFVLVGREIYLHLPNGVARTKLTNAYFDAALGTISTGRNWATVAAIERLVRE